MGFGLRALNRLAGSDLLDRIRIRKQVENALFQGTKNGFRGGDRRRPHLQGHAAARQTRAPEEGQVDGPLRPLARRRAADVPGGRPRLRRRPDPQGGAEGRRGARDPEGDPRPGERARRQHARRPRGARRRDDRAVGGDQRPDRRGARPRRHGHRLRGDGPRRRRHRDRPLGQRRAGGDLPPRLHRRGHPRRRPGDPRAAAAVRPAAAGDEGEKERRRVGPERRQVAARPRQRVRALRHRGRRRGHRPGALHRRVRRQRPDGRGRAGDGPAARRHRPPADRQSQTARPARCSARATPKPRTTPPASTARGSPGAGSRPAPRRPCSTT